MSIAPSRRPLLRLLLIGLLACLFTPMVSAETAKRLRIGITLHPYYSYVANIVGDKAEVVPLIPAGFNPHAYEPRAEDIKRIGGLDVIVLNGVGHDDFADRMIAASETPNVKVIEANADPGLTARARLFLGITKNYTGDTAAARKLLVGGDKAVEPGVSGLRLRHHLLVPGHHGLALGLHAGGRLHLVGRRMLVLLRRLRGESGCRRHQDHRATCHHRGSHFVDSHDRLLRNSPLNLLS